MRYFLDTADMNEIKKWLPFIQGVTSNPIILKNENMTIMNFYMQARTYVDNIFIQIHSPEEKEKLPKGLSTSKLIYKVPLMGDGFNFLKKLNNSGHRTCGTTTYDIIQFHKACDLGCEYCIVLCAKNPDENFLENCVKVKENYNYQTKIVAASFREKKDVEKAIIQRADHLTVPPAVMEKCFYNPYVIKDYNSYKGVSE